MMVLILYFGCWMLALALAFSFWLLNFQLFTFELFTFELCNFQLDELPLLGASTVVAAAVIPTTDAGTEPVGGGELDHVVRLSLYVEVGEHTRDEGALVDGDLCGGTRGVGLVAHVGGRQFRVARQVETDDVVGIAGEARQEGVGGQVQRVELVGAAVERGDVGEILNAVERGDAQAPHAQSTRDGFRLVDGDATVGIAVVMGDEIGFEDGVRNGQMWLVDAQGVVEAHLIGGTVGGLRLSNGKESRTVVVEIHPFHRMDDVGAIFLEGGYLGGDRQHGEQSQQQSTEMSFFHGVSG
jgi:hypothetical protein